MAPPRAFPDAAPADLAAAALGAPPVAWRDASRGHGEARVWIAQAPGGARAVLKAYRTPDKHRREVAAYRRYGPALAPRVATLLATRASPWPAIALTYLPGRTDLPTDDPAAPGVHRDAGAWLARLHRAEPEVDPLPLDVAYARRLAAWTRRAAPHLPAVATVEVRRRVEAVLPDLEGRRRVPCHRDFGPRNWLTRDGRLVAAIDFEHARADVAEADLARLATTAWRRRPALRAAFLEGYRDGGGPADPDGPVAAALAALEALAGVAWAAEHGDDAWGADAREALDAVLASA